MNNRLANQHQRIANGFKDHQLTRRQARQLHREDHLIRAEERADAAFHGSHITRGEQREINWQENQVSRQIRRDRRAGS